MAVKEINESEICALNAQGVAANIAKMVKSMINNGIPAKNLPALFLWGPPGVGKSDAIRQAAALIERGTEKKVVITDVRLLLYNPVDLRGIPVADANKEFAVWLKPKVFMMDGSDDVVNILFLDELTAAPQSVQAAAYQITLDRMIGEHKLPENCIIIAAGNRVTDRSVSYKMPKALANRLCHIEVEADFSAWVDWALKHDIDTAIIGFLSFDPSMLMKFGEVADEIAFPTPRSWEMASNMIKLYGSVEAAMPFITGCVGRAAASALYTWTKVWTQLPKVEDIFSGRSVQTPNRPDVLYALVSKMLAYAKREETDINEILTSIRYAVRLPADFSSLLFKGYLSLENKCSDMRSMLIKSTEFAQWINKNERMLSA